MSRRKPSWNIKGRKSRKRRLREKYGPNCVSCREAFGDSELSLDHIVPLAKGGCNCIKNLQLMCKPCNEAKGAGPQPPFTPAAEASRLGHTKEECPQERRRRRRRAGLGSVASGRLQAPLQSFSLRNPTCVRCGQHVPADQPCLC